MSAEFTLRLCAVAGEIVLNTTASFNSRHAVVSQNPVDLTAPLLQELIDTIPELLIAAPYSHRNVKNKRQERLVDLRRHGHDLHWHTRLFREVTCQRSPDNREIDVTLCHRIDDTRGWIGLAVIAV